MNSPKPVRTILFVSSNDAVRAPMARGFVNTLLGDRYRAASAGTDPGDPDPVALEVMQEVGVDLSDQGSLRAGEISEIPVDYLVTVCDRAKKVCPLFASCGMSFHKGFPEPGASPQDREARLAEYRRLRDEIRAWVERTFA
jgi:arsenate reductase